MRQAAGTYDGMLVATPGDGRVFRVFDPPWWRLDRWVVWYAGAALSRVLGRRVRARARIAVTDLSEPGATKRVRVEEDAVRASGTFRSGG